MIYNEKSQLYSKFLLHFYSVVFRRFHYGPVSLLYRSVVTLYTLLLNKLKL